MLTRAVIPPRSLWSYLRKKGEKSNPACTCKRRTTLPCHQYTSLLIPKDENGRAFDQAHLHTHLGDPLVHTWLPHTSPSPQHRKTRDFKSNMAQLGICSRQPVDIAACSFPPALPLPPPKRLFFFPLSKRYLFLRRQTLGFDCSLWDSYLGLQ